MSMMTTLRQILNENKLEIAIALVIFILGFLIGTATTLANNQITAKTINNLPTNTEEPQKTINPLIRISNPQEKPSPKNRIAQNNITVYDDKIIITLNNPEWAMFTDTNSMDPTLDTEAHAIEIIPKNESEIQVGDIVSYESEYADGTIIHRITQINHDEDGWYAKAKGDNIENEDPGKIRFNQIRRVVVAIIY